MDSGQQNDQTTAVEFRLNIFWGSMAATRIVRGCRKKPTPGLKMSEGCRRTTGGNEDGILHRQMPSPLCVSRNRSNQMPAINHNSQFALRRTISLSSPVPPVDRKGKRSMHKGWNRNMDDRGEISGRCGHEARVRNGYIEEKRKSL